MFEYISKTVQKYIRKNKQEYFEYIKSFEDQGKQGIVGLLRIKDCNCVFKISQNLNFVVRHEYEVMKSLLEIHNCCPYFVRPYGILKHQTDFDFKNNVFEPKFKKTMNNETLLLEHIDYTYDFTDYIEDNSLDEECIYSTIKQVLCALVISQNLKNFCHYDLHSSNILMTDCDKDLVVMYIINDKNSICVPTFGKFPKIIDFGFSYTSDLENKNFYTTLAHTDVGFMSCTNDFISDLKLFLVTCSYDINHHRNSINSRNLRHVIRNIFKPLDIDWEAGWDHYTRAGATDKLLEHINHLYSPSKLFQKYDHYCIDIFQSLVKLPLRPKKYDKINLAVTSFIKEFHKIEENVNCSIISLYILRQIVEHSRHLKSNYKKNVKETSLQFTFSSIL